jgi:hypothetical protein
MRSRFPKIVDIVDATFLHDVVIDCAYSIASLVVLNQG